MPAPRSACTIIAEVVVLPCVPATAIVRLSALSSPSSSARGRSGSPRSRAATRSDVLGRDRRGVDQLHALARGEVLRAVAQLRVEHTVRAQALDVGASRRRAPRRSRSPALPARAPRARSRSSPRRPRPRSAGAAPPTALPRRSPALLAHRPAARAARSATSRAASGRASPRRPPPSPPAGRGSASSPPTSAARRGALSSSSAITIAAPALGHPARVRRSGDRPTRAGRARGSPAAPWAAISNTEPPARATTRSAARERVGEILQLQVLAQVVSVAGARARAALGDRAAR